MKRRILCLLLALCMALSLVPVTVSAEEESGAGAEAETHIDLDQAQIYIGQDRVSNVRLSGPGWRFDKETDTLILNNFSIGGTSAAGFMGEKWEDIYETSYIYVGGSGVNLKIRSEGNEENWIGGYECMGKPSTIVYNKWGYGVQYFSYGIYNPYGTVEITGSTPLNIYTHSIGIYAKHITMHGANVTVNTYACPIYAWDRKASVFNVTGNSVVNIHAYSSQEAYTPYSGIAADSAVYAYELNVSEGSRLNAEIERIDTPITDRVQALYLQKLNVNGGKVSAICRDDGKNGTREERINSAAKVMDAIVVSGGGEVEGYIYNPTPFRSGSFAFSGRIKKYFAGSGVIRGGVKVTDGSGDLLGLTDFEYPAHARVTYSDTNNRPDGFAVYQEVTVTPADGVLLRDGKTELEWSYYNDFQSIDGITKPDGTQASIDLSGKELRKVIANSSNLPVIIQSGKFYLNTASDDGEALTPGTIEIKKGAELVVFGEGKINDLNVIGEGKITFLGSTVTGKVDKAVTMVVDGGNINVDYEGTVTTSGGKKVSRFEYTLTSDETTFEQATYVTLLDGQNYGSAGLYPFDGKKLYLWVTKNSDIRHVSAVQSGVENGFTLYPTSSNACLLEKTEVADISKRTYYVAVPGQNSQIIPFEKGTGHAERYDLSWSFSDDGYTWHRINNQEAIGANGELNLTDVYSAWSNRMYRCEIRSKEDGNHTLLGVYTGLLYIYDPEFRCEGGFVDGKEVTVRFTPTKQPGISSCRISSIFWEVSKDGKTFETQKAFSGKDSYTFTVSDEMDGWVLRCSAIAGNSLSVQNRVIVEKTYTIHVTEKKVRIEEQPENEQWIDRDSDENASVSVKARHATHYQWQVSKRPYVNSVGYGFEDIPGATDSTYSFPMKSVTKENWNYVYRCVVSNEYSEVISNEVYFQTKQDPEIMGFDARTTVAEGEEAAIDVRINQGNPSVANTTFWEVSTDSGVTYQNLGDVMSGDEYTVWGVEFSYSGGISFTTSSSLRVYKVTAAMDGWIFRYTLNANGETMRKTAALTVHQHEWSDELTYDGENHWYPCTTPTCGAKKDEAAHSYGEDCDPYCTVCGRERAVSHDFRLMSSETEHWYQCAACKLERGRQDHSYDSACDSDCNVCKRTREITHSYEWQCDETNHWQQCSACGDISGTLESHSFTEEKAEEPYLKSTASCTEKAVYYKSCGVCGRSSAGTENEAEFTTDDVLGHDFGEWTSNGDGTHTRTCRRDAEHTETGNCSGGTATCIEMATCEICGGKYGALGKENHAGRLGDWMKDPDKHWKEYSCCHAMAEEGVHSFGEGNVCDICDYDRSQAHTHALTSFAANEPTCTEPGNEAYYTCSGCDAWFADAEGTVKIDDKADVMIPAKGHTPSSDWMSDETEHWKKCVVGSCGEIIESSRASHTAGEWIVEQEATEDAVGTKYKACTICQHRLETAEIPKVGHTHHYGDWSFNETHHWRQCEEKGCDEISESAAHSFQWKVDQDATTTETGRKHEECTVCGARRSENTVIPKLSDGGKSDSGPGSNRPSNSRKPNNVQPSDSGKLNAGIESPKTGDSGNMPLWAALLFISGGAAVILGTAVCGKRKNGNTV